MLENLANVVPNSQIPNIGDDVRLVCVIYQTNIWSLYVLVKKQMNCLVVSFYTYPSKQSFTGAC